MPRRNSLRTTLTAHRAPLAKRRLAVELLEERSLLSLQGNTLFPADNPWNQRVDSAPIAANSGTLVNSIGASTRLHPDFGTVWEVAYIGIPFNVVSASQPKIEVVIDEWPDESDLGPVPIPAGAIIEGDPLPSSQNDGDRHLIVYDQDNNVAYELYNVRRPSETPDGKWHAYNQAYWDFDENWFRNPGDTSADAAGLPILPGLVRPDEVLDQGRIDHALRFTVPRSRDQYVYPASHQAGVNNASYPRMGERFRLKADFDISGFSPTNQVILRALKEYGMIVADNGSGWYLSGQPSSRWDDDELSDLAAIRGSDFEAVDLRPIVVDLPTDSGPAAGGTSVTIVGQNFSGAAGMLDVYFGTTQAMAVNIVSDTTIVVASPAHAPGTVQVSVVTPYGTSATTPGAQFTYTSPSGSSIAGRHLFYNQSKFDGNSAATGASDDAAIAPDKSAYLPGSGAATFANITSYSRGINGVMVDIAGTHGALSAGDFRFKMSSQAAANNAPGTWAAAPAPAALVVRPGAGVGGSDRVEITWATGAIVNRWLEVIVEGNDAAGGFNANTGLAESDRFYFGSRVGDTGSGTATLAVTSAADELAARGNSGSGATIANLFDFDRSGAVSAVDNLIARGNAGTLTKINLSDPPAAPGVAFAFALQRVEQQAEASPVARVEVRQSHALLDARAPYADRADARVAAFAAMDADPVFAVFDGGFELDGELLDALLAG